MAVRDSPVIAGSARETQKIRIMGDDDPRGDPGEFKVSLIIKSPQARFPRRRYIDSVTAKRPGNGGINVLVQVKANTISHGSGL